MSLWAKLWKHMATCKKEKSLLLQRRRKLRSGQCVRQWKASLNAVDTSLLTVVAPPRAASAAER